VLELATLNAGPGLGAMLADFGADVVKVEPPTGDDFRVLGAAGGGTPRPGLWNLVARNKRMVTLDYRRDEGIEVLGRLTAVADVVLVNQPFGLLERIGCSYEAIAERNPGAIVVHVSGWGATGPYRDLAGNGTLGEAFAGLTDQQRVDGEPPRLSPVLFGDHLTALAGMIGTLAACYWRDANGGRGQFVDVALYEAVLGLLGPQLVTWTAPDPTTPAEPTLRRRASGIRDTFGTADGRWVTVTSYSQAQISRLLDTVGVDVAAGGPEPDLAELVATWIAQNDESSVLNAFREARIGIAPVNDLASLMADPHAVERGAVTEVDDPTFGPVRLPGPTSRLAATPTRVRWVSRDLGADNDSVYAEWLDLAPAELDRLRGAGVI
jgi:crotonobetainyl-CoA:carnitine CoA-transferase CaiB-like acyl-CoA transferase